jgi:hypothetical protein
VSQLKWSWISRNASPNRGLHTMQLIFLQCELTQQEDDSSSYYIYLTNVACISYPSLFIILIYCAYKSNVLRVSSITGVTLYGIINLVTIHMSPCVTYELLSSYFYKYSHLKIYQMNCYWSWDHQYLCYVPVFCMMNCYWEIYYQVWFALNVK